MRHSTLKTILSATAIGLASTSALAADKLTELTLSEAAARIQSGQLSSLTLTQALIAQAQEHANLNAFISLDTEGALLAAAAADKAREQGQPLDPLHGVPMAIKDNIHVLGLPNTAGTPALKDFRPAAHAPVISRLVAAGAIMIGKTNMHELAFGITSDNATFGAVGNPYAPEHTAGGSSGGSGAAVAAGMVPAALGTDTGGSVRIPAALNGIYSLRPTMGRYPSGGITPISHTRDTAGPMARSVADLALLDGVLAEDASPTAPAPLKNLRIGLPRDYFYTGLDQELSKVMEDSIKELESAGVEFVTVNIDGIGELNSKMSFPIALYEGVEDLTVYLDEYNTGTDFNAVAAATASPDVAGLFAALSVVDENGDGQPDGRIPEAVYRAAIDTHRPALQELMTKWYEDNELDAMWVPTTPLPAQPTAQLASHALVNGAEAPAFPTYIQNTDPDSNAGFPSINIPVGLTETGLPVGAMLAGPANSDRRLLNIALSLEALFGHLSKPKL